MHSRYDETIDQIVAWCHQAADVEGAVIIGSQVRNELQADQWSDLDVMLLVNDPAQLLNETHWLDSFGKPVCVFNTITVLHFTNWNWCVKRALYDDQRDIDFSILPYAQLNEVLWVNKDIMARGYQVIYDSKTDQLESQIGAIVEPVGQEKSELPTEEALNNDLNDLLFHIIWALKKLKRKELWVAVNCINEHISRLLLGLIEVHNQSVTRQSTIIMHEGRFLESRTNKRVIEKLKYCFTRYDEQDVINTLGCLIETTFFISSGIFKVNGYSFNPTQFEMIRQMYCEIISEN